MHRLCCLIATAVVLATAPVAPARAWGDEGHEVIALIAQAYLDPPVRDAVSALLAADTDPLTTHDIAGEATWADRLRDHQSGRERTAQWHFADIEIGAPNLDEACFDHPVLPAGVWASKGPAQDCIIDKIVQFEGELAQPATPEPERLMALKFLLHFVGDLHQPLHAADSLDRGGNAKRVSADGFRAGNLHQFWDTAFVARLGADPQIIAADLRRHISDEQVGVWSRGMPTDWALETFALARDDAYGPLPVPTLRGGYRLDSSYVAMAKRDVSMQLSRAGVRLAAVLNRALGP